MAIGDLPRATLPNANSMLTVLVSWGRRYAVESPPESCPPRSPTISAY